MAKSPAGASAHDDWTVGAFGLIMMILVFCLFMKGAVIRVTTIVLYFLWRMADFPRIHSYTGLRITLLADIHNKADIVTWGDYFSTLNLTAGILLIAFIPLGIVGVIAVRRHQSSRGTREINIYTLPRIMSKVSPSIIPALHYGDPKTQLLNVDPPEHRSGQHPDEFAKEHRLIVNKQLNRDKAEAVFIKQLGNPINDKYEPPTPATKHTAGGLLGRLISRLTKWRKRQVSNDPLLPAFQQFNGHERAMFAIFGLQHFLDNRKEAENLLDNLNRSTANRHTPGYPNLNIATRGFYQVARTPQAKAWIKKYRYIRTAIAALHDNDLHLPSARFRWLKGMDRHLWYALTSTGRPVPFVEGAGIVSQMQWERMAAKHKVTLSTPMMDLAIDGLERYMVNIGVITDYSATISSSGIPAEPEDGIEDDGDDDIPDDEEPAAASPRSHKLTNTFRPRMK